MKFINNSYDLTRYLGIPVKKNIDIKSISTDTRSIKKGALFIAIKGDFFNGNDYVENAISQKACLVITDDKKFKDSKNKKIIYVNNSILALRKISRNIIKDYSGNIIGITGSNGKTSTTNIIANSLKSCSSTLKNFNNEIGVPLSIMSANRKSKNLVIEMGAAKLNDINYLSSFLRPNIGVITNIGNSHLQSLKNIRGVFKVKSELITNIKKGGCLVVPNDNKSHLKLWKIIRNDIDIITFGLKPSADFYPSDIKYSLEKTQFYICSKKYKVKLKVATKLAGEHNVKNILASFAVSFFLNKPSQIFADSLNKKLDLITTRQKHSKWLKNSLLIDDTYNANPDSVKKSIDLLTSTNKRKVFVLGDMLELGRFRKKMHKDIGKYAAFKKIDIFLGFGNLTKYSVESFGKKGFFFKNEDDLRKYLRENINSKDVVLLKGSRGMKMERFINV
jgi:UDP-N-acetylmuramoyl-tripeptide--D-alanyl-D-alanine ligase